MEIRLWDRVQDYPMIKEWYQGCGSMGPHPSQLPPLGVVASDEEGEHAAVGAYQSLGVGVAFPEWLVTNPSTSTRRKLDAVITAMEGLELILVSQGYEMQRIAVIDDRIAKLAAKMLGYADLGVKVNYLVKNTTS